MKIVHVLPSLDPAYGGPVSVATQLAAAQVQLGHTVTVLGACSGSRVKASEENRSMIPSIDRVRLIPVHLSEKRFDPGFVIRFVKAFAAQGHHDVCHIHGLWEPGLFGVSVSCQRRGIPFIVCVHGMLDTWSLNQKKLKKKIALRLVYSKMLRAASAIHALNSHEAEVIQALDFGTPIKIIPNGFFIGAIKADTSGIKISNRLSSLGTKAYVLFLGRLHHKKGLDLLAHAWRRVVKQMPDMRLVIAGPREDDSVDQFHMLTAQQGLQDTVLEIGPVYGEEKWSVLRQSACFVLPSRQEGFSVAVLEALSQGIPVVLSEECHFPEIADNRAGIVCALEPSAIADALIRVLSDKPFREQASVNAQALVESQYGWTGIAKRSIETYQQFCAPVNQ